ncbi:MAG: hypothetical protein U0326_44380 [Polyangiales bacterium]
MSSKRPRAWVARSKVSALQADSVWQRSQVRSTVMRPPCGSRWQSRQRANATPRNESGSRCCARVWHRSQATRAWAPRS